MPNSRFGLGRVLIAELCDFDPELVATLLDWEAVEHLFLREQIDAVGDVVLPAVPWACDAVVVELTLRDRTTLMSTHAVDGIELFRCAKDRDDATFDQ